MHFNRFTSKGFWKETKISFSCEMADRLYISSHQRCSVKRGVLKNFTKFTGKHLARPSTLLKKRLQHRCFPKNFVKFPRTSFIQNTSGRLLLPVLLDRWFRFYPSNKNNSKGRFYPRKHSYRKHKNLPKKELRFLKVNCCAASFIEQSTKAAAQLSYTDLKYTSVF